jgi:hypothetical protein
MILVGACLPGSAQRGLLGGQDNGTANHAEHAKGGGALPDRYMFAMRS